MIQVKKFITVIILPVLICFGIFGQTEGPEEIDFLLFMPDSGKMFVNETQAMVQLDNLSLYLKNRNPAPGGIFVYGYAADVSNGIEPFNLSMERAVFIINELQKRGVPENMFSDPVACGSVDLWGSNSNEEARSPNRRARILVDGAVITPETIKAEEPVIPAATSVIPQEPDMASAKKFPWWILLLLLLFILIAGLMIAVAGRRKKSAKNIAQPVQDSPRATAPAAVLPAAVILPVIPTEPVIVPIAGKEIIVNLDDEIRYRAYMLFLERGGFSESAGSGNAGSGSADSDWYTALPEIRAKYEAEGYSVSAVDNSWWARKT